MPYRRFLAASLIGTCLWTVALCLAGYFLFERLALARDLALGVGLALLLVAVVVAFRAAAGRRGAAARGRVGPVADEG